MQNHSPNLGEYFIRHKGLGNCKKINKSRFSKVTDIELIKRFGIEVRNEIIKDFDSKNVLNGINFPLCPDCDKCTLIQDCKTYGTVNLSINLNNYVKDSNTNQKELQKLFN